MSCWIFICFWMPRDQPKALFPSSVAKELVPFSAQVSENGYPWLFVLGLNYTEHLVRFIFNFQFSNILGTEHIIMC